MIKRFLVPLVGSATMAIILLAGCSSSGLTDPDSIRNGRLENGTEVTVEGTVLLIDPVQDDSGAQAYEVASEESSNVWVKTDKELPKKGERVRVTGVVTSDITVGGQDVGVGIEETSRVSAGSGIKPWMWIVGGLLLAAVVAAVVVALVAKRKRSGSGEASPPCPHCGAETEAGWVVCTMCGKRLTEAPPASGTIIVTPTAPSPMVEDPQPEPPKRQSMPTIIAPPDLDEDD